jgi:hypothetical protein
LFVQSLLLLAAVAGLLAVPGIAASLAAFAPGEISIVTRTAAAFGLGYAAAGGCAFILAAAHEFRLSFFLPLWFVVSAVLWVLAVRRAPLREHARAFIDEFDKNRVSLLLGALVFVAILAVHFKFIHLLGAPRYVYYLNGIEIANAGGVPARTFEYGQSWPPATDKIFLDAFTGVAVLINHNVAIGPGVLLWASIVGSALGLWAAAWELGLRRTGALLPLLVMSNQQILNTLVTGDFTDYRAEDFGRAIAFCAFALGIYAIRQRRWLPAVIAGIVLAAATGSHLIPVVLVVIAICIVGVVELIRRDTEQGRPAIVRAAVVLFAVAGVLGIVIRLLAGGAFGLGGASNPSGYRIVHTSFDPTQYLFTGQFSSRAAAAHRLWYIPPVKAIEGIMAVNGINWTAWGIWLLFAGCLVAAVLLFLFARTDVRAAGLTGAGIIATVIGVALVFDYHYHIYIDATAGIRRFRDFLSLGLILIALGLIEGLLGLLAARWSRLSAVIAVLIVVSLAAWLLPSSAPTGAQHRISHQRVLFVNWVRTHTPCGARFLVNQRTEGAFTALTGRFALLEGMGPFLRADKLPYVVDLMLSARRFFASPASNEAFLRQHRISYVVVARPPMLLGYSGPPGRAYIPGLDSSPFLHRVLTIPSLIVYQVQGVQTPPVSPLLKGPYLHCMTTRVHL